MQAVVGVLLAGGQARRMGGGDKGLKEIGGRPLLAHVIERARPQVARLVLNANGDPARFAGYGLSVVADGVLGFPGPLAGILAGMDWARLQEPDVPWLVSLPTDTPFMPPDLVAGLVAMATLTGAEITVAASGGRAHPVVALWPVRLAGELRRALAEEGVRKIDAWTARYRTASAEFPVVPHDPFFNVNTPDDVAEAERLLATGS